MERFLEKWPEYRGKFTFVQIGAPSRTEIQRYHDFLQEVEGEAVRINARWQTADWKPIALLTRHHGHEEIVPYYRAADFCMVTSLHDGMNLVAKEFVAARDDEGGALILQPVHRCCPRIARCDYRGSLYDAEQLAEAIHVALEMNTEERQARMRLLRTNVKHHNVYGWAGNLITELSEIRIGELEPGRSRSMSAMQKSAKLECEADVTAAGSADGAVANTRTHWIPPPAGGKRAARSPRYLFRAWSEIKSQICSAELCALLLDFDGTLVRIQRRPWEVRVPQRIKGLLERLTLNPKLFVAIVSGRRYQDLRTRIGIENLRYIGLHGAEEDGNSICIGTDVGKILSTAKLEAQKQIASMRGIRIEDKGLSFAVHYREATPLVAAAARSCLLQLVLPLHQSLKVFEGAMVWEVLPHEIQGKGAAARALMNRLPSARPRSTSATMEPIIRVSFAERSDHRACGKCKGHSGEILSA